MAQKKIIVIYWSEQAKKHYFEILDYLEKEAPHVLQTVGKALIDTIENLIIQHHSYPLDRFKKKNDGTFRAALVYNYRISYQVGTNSINILRIRHTSRSPLKH
jgi:plasmid stabilization system protein ParE